MEALQQAFPEFKDVTIRVDHDSMRASVIDVAQLVTERDHRYTAKIVQRILRGENQLWTKCPQLRINGKGRLTSVADAATLIEIIFLLPGRIAREFRRKSALYICRLLGGDLSLVPEIRAQNARIGGTLAQAFLLQPVADVNRLEWNELRELACDATRMKSDAIRAALPNAGCGIYARNNGLINKSVSGFSKTEIRKKFDVKGNFVARNYMTCGQLAMVRAAEYVTTGVYDAREAELYNSKLDSMYGMVSNLADLGQMKRKCLEAPLRLLPPKKRRIEEAPREAEGEVAPAPPPPLMIAAPRVCQTCLVHLPPPTRHRDTMITLYFSKVE